MEITQQLPPGWESFYSKEAGRHYFVDHIGKSTQWEDPRLTHPFIWGNEENEQLQKLMCDYESMPEAVLRETLLRSSFDVRQVVADLKLRRLNERPPSPAAQKDHQASPRRSTTPTSNRDAMSSGAARSPPPKMSQTVTTMVGGGDDDERRRSKVDAGVRRRASPSNHGGGGGDDNGRRRRSGGTMAGTCDDFAFLAVKSKFSELPDVLIRDVLYRCNNDEEKAVQELRSAGFDASRRQAAVDRAERIELDEAEKLKLRILKKSEGTVRLVSEFPSFSEEEISEIFEKAGEDLTEARSILREKEAKYKMDQISSANRTSSKCVNRQNFEDEANTPLTVSQYVRNHSSLEKVFEDLHQIGLKTDMYRQIVSDRQAELDEVSTLKLKQFKKTEAGNLVQQCKHKIGDIHDKAGKTLPLVNAERIELDEVEKLKLKILKKTEGISRLLSEFPSFSEQEIDEIFDKAGEDLTEARSILREKETKRSVEQTTLTNRASSKSVKGRKVEEFTASEYMPLVRVEDDDVVDSSGLAQFSKTKTEHLGASSSLPTNKAYQVRVSIAVGPDKSLRQRKCELAKGSDKTIRCGPNPVFLEFASFKKYSATKSS